MSNSAVINYAAMRLSKSLVGHHFRSFFDTVYVKVTVQSLIGLTLVKKRCKNILIDRESFPGFWSDPPERDFERYSLKTTFCLSFCNFCILRVAGRRKKETEKY